MVLGRYAVASHRVRSTIPAPGWLGSAPGRSSLGIHGCRAAFSRELPFIAIVVPLAIPRPIATKRMVGPVRRSRLAGVPGLILDQARWPLGR